MVNFGQPSGFQNVTVIGGGFMGAGIAEAFAAKGFDTTVYDLDDKAVSRAKKKIEVSIRKAHKGRFETDIHNYNLHVFSHLKFSTNFENSVKNADLVVEAIPENLELKQNLFARLEKRCAPSTVFATNTSSLLLKQMSEKMQNKSRLGGLHFFFPVPQSGVVEVMKSEYTSDELFQRLVKVAVELGKHPLKCKDTPAFIVNRIINVMFDQAFQMVEDGICSVEDVDIGLEKAMGHPIGPFKTLDRIGLDTAKKVRDEIARLYPDLIKVRSNSILDKLVKEGHLGVKTGQGFYKYSKKAKL
ncbi:unnamed protein product [Bursaphelenchus okinawaensis]|uniref:3-hydroxyacyl-CoA dehydrogenase n=1 Tax=Bursaphelenchus okinawaensis TaxID=465554 RepID=A0A811LKR1_9BILA|nr:unnamed protein product [Bursaphelenchus okinawaensis]CAG9124878.1 unnamed protein product [Bursaphelenchus okinawaensis]